MTKISYDSIKYDDPAVWDLICSGRTFGCFQMESYLVQDNLRKIQPRNLWELSAVIALIRPGALDSGMAAQYIENKNNPLAMKLFNNAIIDRIFNSTQGVLCIHENTRIALSDGGYKLIKDIKRGDMVKSYNPLDKKIYNRACHGCAKTKTGKGYKITLSNGEFVIVTPDHKVMTYTGLKRADALDIHSDCVAFAKSQFAKTGDDSKELSTEMYLLGQIIGDGDVSGTGNILSAGSEFKADILTDWINTHTKYTARKYFRGRCWYLSITSATISGSKKTCFNEYLRSINLKGKNCYNKFIPEYVYTSSLSEQAAFLAGYLESDGCFHSEGVHLTSVNQTLLDGVGHILRNLGVLYTRDAFRIRITDVNLLLEYVKPYLLICEYKGCISAGRNGPVVPWSALEEKLEELRLRLSRRDIEKEYRTNTRKKSNFVKHRRYSKLGIDTGDVVFYQIRSIEPVEEAVFYDMSVDEFHTLLGNGIVLSNCYQEQLMNLGTDLAWIHLAENERLIKADDLRKAVGKKDQNKILAIGKDFVAGCVQNGVAQELADQLFEIIKNCGRYLFNLSHSMAYAYRAYQMAWLKHYYPLQFYTCSLNLSHEKLEPEIEVNNLVQDAKSRGITVLPPNINSRNENFIIEGGDKIRFGLGYIKFAGNSFGKMEWPAEQIKDWKVWLRWVIEGPLRAPTVLGLIEAGAFSDLGVHRIVLKSVYEFVKELTDKEIAALWDKLTPLAQITDLPIALTDICNTVTTKRRRQTLSSEIIILERNLKEVDHPMSVEYYELRTMGTVISPSAIAKLEHLSDMTCFELNNMSQGEVSKTMTLMCIIDDVLIKTIKTGKNAGKLMASISVHDSYGQMKHLPVFSKVFEESTDLLRKMNPVQIQLDKKERGFFVRGITQVTI